MTMYKKEITDDDIVEAIHELIADSDCDDLASIADYLFGIDTFFLRLDENNTPIYEMRYNDQLKDNQEYGGAFGYPDDDETWEKI